MTATRCCWQAGPSLRWRTAVFFAIGATVASRLAPPGQGGRAIALMFSGLTLAMVIGVPPAPDR